MHQRLGLDGDRRPVVVTGVAGFIGHHTAKLLLEWGVPVIGIDSFTPYYDRRIKEHNLAAIDDPRFDFYETPVDSELTRQLLQGSRAVIHLAAQPGVRDSWHDFDNYVDLNVRTTKQLLEDALAVGGCRVVCASSSSVYGNSPRYPTTESAPLSPRSPYGITKLAAERLAVAYAHERGLSTVCLRYFTVFGPAQRPDMAIERLIRAAHMGTPFPMFGDGEQIRDFTFVGDIARANVIAALSDLEPGEVLNVCGETPATLNEVVSLVEQVTGYPVRVQRFGVSVGDVERTGGTAERINALFGWEAETSLADGIVAQDAEVRRRLNLELVGAPT